MRSRIKRCWVPLLMTCATLPLPLLAGCSTNAAGVMRWLLLPLLFCTLACLCLLVPGRIRAATGAVCCALLLAAGGLLLPWRQHGVLLLIPLLYAGLLLHLLPMPAHDPMLPFAWLAVGPVFHLLAQLYLFLQPSTALPRYAPAQLPLLLAFLWVLLISFLLLNQQTLDSAMPDGAVPLSIRRRSRLLTLGLFGLSLLVAALPAIGRMLAAAWRGFSSALGMLVRWLNQLLALQEGGGGGMGGDPAPLMQEAAAQPGLVSQILQKLAIALVCVALAAGAVMLLRLLWQKLRAALRWLAHHLRRYISAAGEDYVDVLEDTRTQGEERSLRGLLRSRRRALRQEALPPREAIRRQYALLRGRHPEWPASHTARETLSAPSAQLYERARYSAHPITQEDAERFTKANG